MHAVSVRHFPQAIRNLDRLSDAEVELREHIGAAEAEHQEHVRGPPADALHAREGGDYLLVVQLVKPVNREIAGRHATRQIPEVSYFLSGQTGGTKLFIGGDQQSLGGWGAVEEGYDAAVDGCGRATRQLLIDDSADDVVEVRALGASGESARADVGHDASEHGVAAEVGNGAAVHGLQYVFLGDVRRMDLVRRELGGAAGTRTLDSRNTHAPAFSSSAHPLIPGVRIMRVRDYATLAALAGAAACGSSTQPMTNNGAPCPGSAQKTIVSLAVGGVEAVTVPANLDCVSLATSDGTAGSFLVVAANADTKGDVTGSYDLAVAQPTTAAADMMAVGRIRSATVATDLRGATGSIAEGRFRAMERRVLHLDEPGVRSAVSAFMRRASTGVHTASVPNVGDTLTFKVPDANAQNSCATFTTQRAVVKTVGVHGIIVQDITAPAGGFTAAAFDSIETEFDQIIYPTDTVHFGSPSDIDGNGHVFLLFTPQVNAATPRGSHGILAGFFFDGDLFPTTGPNSCAESNEGEIFYLLTPDPTGQFSDVRSTSSVRQSIRGTMAHEFQHMINAGVRLFKENAPNEVVWLNEGLSHFAEELVGRAEDSFSDTQKLVIGDVADFPSLDNFNAFFGQNMARLREFMLTPGTLGATSIHADTSLAVRGAAWSLLRYSADHYAGGNVAAFTRALVAGPDTGVANLVARTGTSFDSVAAGWLPALYASDDGVAGLPARYTYLSWDIRSIEAAVNSGTFPLVATTLSAGNTAPGSVSSAAANYYLVGVPASGTVLLGELATNGGPVTYAGARLYIVRLQ